MSFWETKKLADMTAEEWESLCDHCGKCCLHKLEDEDTGDIYFTRVACKLLDLSTCRCTRYSERTRLVPECLNLKQYDFSEYDWLPATCAYRLVNAGADLPAWHPLLSKNADSVQESGESIRAYAIMESEVDDVEDLEDYIIEWLQ